MAQTTPKTLPAATNYFAVSITNDTQSNTGGVADSGLYLSLVSQTQAYTFTQYQNAESKTVYVATIDAPTGDSVASIPLSSLVNEIDSKKGFYVEVYTAGAAVPFTGGRLYFATKANAVPYLSGAPLSIAPDAGFDFDFIEFTVDVTTGQLNFDTTQVDQFGMPIYLQVDPVVPDFAAGTGIVSTLNRAGVISAFETYTDAASNFTAYAGVAPSTGGVQRLLAPQHVIDAHPDKKATKALREAFDGALYRLFNHYYSGTGGGGHTLYLVGNGSNGFEIFAGTVIDTFSAKDHNGNSGTYTVFQFTGTNYAYDGSDATLTPVPSGGGAVYQIYYPYFSDNDANSVSPGFSSASKAPFWYGGFSATDKLKYNLPITSAGRMVFGASGSFADNTSQHAYYVEQGALPANFDPVMLGNLENQLVTMLNRGIAPDTGSITQAQNLWLRTGANTNNDLIFVDLTDLTSATTSELSGTPNGAQMNYTPSDLLTGAGAGSGNGIVWSGLSGTIYFKGGFSTLTAIQTFSANADDVTQAFALTNEPSVSPTNSVSSAQFGFDTAGQVSEVRFNWESAVDLNASGAKVSFAFDYGAATTEAHFATLRLFSPYSQTAYTFVSGDLGPTSDFSTGLVGASADNEPTSGMTMTAIGLSNPTYVYKASAARANAITIYSPQALPQGGNTSILAFSTFYPVETDGAPIGGWNAYAAFFHIGDPAHGYAAPTVDGKGYAFAFDDNGGYSSDITVTLPTGPQTPAVISTLDLTLLPWKAPAG